MTFQAYLDAVRSKTGMTPEQLQSEAVKVGVYNPSMKASDLIAWLANQYGLGRGHSMSVWAVWKSNGWVQAPRTAPK